MIELLTVITIIAILATLLASALAAAKQKGRIAACTSNLRQIGLALNMYLDDQVRRPSTLPDLVRRKYLPAAGALRCPEDETGNWGGLVEQGFGFSSAPPNLILFPGEDSAQPNRAGAPAPARIPYSYLHPFPWEDWAWNKLMRAESEAGIAVCQVHGLGKPDLNAPSIRNFEGRILRAQMDGAVVRRQIFWNTAVAPADSATPTSVTVTFSGSSPPPQYPWRLFMDEYEPEP